MSTTVDIELVPSEEDHLLEPAQEATTVDTELVPSDCLLQPIQEATTVDIELVPSEEDRLLATLPKLPLQSKHTIFLSHSGAQKNFVEQLCLDLEHQLHHTPFFHKRSYSLPKGEVFAQYIFQAAQQCELAIVVVSEEYFSQSKWPMLELSMLVQSSKRKILPLFFGLSCKQFGDAEQRERWFQTWDAWAQMDPRVSVEDWKLALRELDRRNGLEFVVAVGEVAFRKEVLATVSDLVPPHVPILYQIFNQRGALSRLLCEGALILLKVIGWIFIGYVVFNIAFTLLFSKGFDPIFENHMTPFFERFVKGVTEGSPEGSPKGIPEGFPEGFPIDLFQGFFKGSPQSFSQGYPQGFSKDFLRGSPQGFFHGSPPSFSKGFLKGSPQGFFHGSPPSFSKGSPQGFSQGFPQGFFQGF